MQYYSILEKKRRLIFTHNLTNLICSVGSLQQRFSFIQMEKSFMANDPGIADSGFLIALLGMI